MSDLGHTPGAVRSIFVTMCRFAQPLFLAGVLYQVSSLVRSAELAALRTQCRALAEGGLEVARSQIATNPPPVKPLDIEVPGCLGECRVRVVPAGQAGTYHVTVTARQVYRPNQLASYEIEATLNTGPLENVYQVEAQRFGPRSGTLSAPRGKGEL